MDHFVAAAEREAVYLACQHLFPRSVLAGDQDVCIRLGYFGHDFDELHHDRGMADNHRWFARSLWRRQRLSGLPSLQGGAYLFQQAVIVPGLEHEIGSPAFQSLYRQFDVSVGRQHDNGQPRCDLLYPAKPEKPFVTGIDAGGEVHIQQDKVDRPAVQNRQDAVRVRGSLHLLELVFQEQFEGGQHALVVIYYQDCSGLHSLFFL